MKGFGRSAVAALLCGTALPAVAFERTVTPEEGYSLFWNTREVEFEVNDEGTRNSYGCSDASAAIAETIKGFEAWTYARLPESSDFCTDFHFVYTGTTVKHDTGNDGRNRVVWRLGNCDVSPDDPCHEENTCGNEYNCWDNTDPDQVEDDPIALTTVSYSRCDGSILDADIELHGWDSEVVGSDGFYFTCVEPDGDNRCASKGDDECVSIDVRSVVTHEAGHVLGLADLKDYTYYESTMYYNVVPGNTDKRDLAADDIQGACDVYPVGAASPTSVPVCDEGGGTGGGSSEETSSGCGAGSAGSGALILIAAFAALRRRRKRQ